ncbi:MAG: pentapeptide repeat-containing protein [Leptolyngbya sp. SIO1E4]|nr:pentapeptide repeat-containing protein [Leptolyngbya sp. SIO1E4]
MADEVDYLDLIGQGVEHWNRWREDHPDHLPDLSRAYLFEAELKGVNLSGVDLSRACLIGANLQGANLSKANLQHVYASKANLEGADLSGVAFKQANFSEARLMNTNLSHVKAEGANLSTADLTGACVENWQINAATDLSGTKCDYLYQTQPQQDRYPQSGNFDPETFTQFIKRYRVSEAPARANVLAPPSSPAPPSSQPAPPASLITVLSLLPDPWSTKLLRASRQVNLSTRQWVFIAGVSVLGVAIILAALVNLFARMFTPRQLADSPLLIGPNVNLASLPCNELPPPDLQNEEPSHVYNNETEFYGQFENGLPLDGRGIMLFANGDRYDGEFRIGQRNGCGTFTFSNGRQYMGEFRNDQFHGVGIWQLESGERYVGQFEDNKCEGWGTFLFTDGSSKSGTWKDGTLVGDTLSCNRGIVSEPETTAQ